MIIQRERKKEGGVKLYKHNNNNTLLTQSGMKMFNHYIKSDGVNIIMLIIIRVKENNKNG